MPDDVKAEQTLTGGAAPAAVAPAPPAGGSDKPPTEKPTQIQDITPEKLGFINLRKKEKEARETSERLRQENEQLKTQLESAKSRPVVPEMSEAAPSVLDDPDGFTRWNTKKAEQAAENKYRQLEAENQNRQRESELIQAAESATKWLLSQPSVKEDLELAKPIAELLATKRGQRIAEADPEVAMEWALGKVLKEKGISDTTDGRSTTGVRPSVSSPGGKPVFTRGEAQKWANEVSPSDNPDEYRRRAYAIAEAEREGRIR